MTAAAERRVRKASAAVLEDRVTEDQTARVYPVIGSRGDVYTVVLYASGKSICNCPAGKEERPCYHVSAARIAANRITIARCTGLNAQALEIAHSLARHIPAGISTLAFLDQNASPLEGATRLQMAEVIDRYRKS